jgi:Transcriptional regulator containing an amidase domain and an AraC-type DNA-binding HTH domain
MIKKKDGFNGERAIVLPKFVVQEMENDPISSNLHITDIGYYPKAKHHFRERKEPISTYVFIYCIEGAGWYRLNNQVYHVCANQYFILPANQEHAYGADEDNPWTIYWIHFKGSLASYFASRSTKPINVKPGINSRITNRIDLFEEIVKTLEMGYNHENLLYACSIFYHYLGTLRYLNQYREAGDKSNANNNDVVTAAIHIMKENIEKRLSLKDIAEYTGYSPSHFSVLFSKRTGYAPLAYFNQLKIQQACHLLDFTDMKINQVCYKIGIDDYYYFSRLFSKIMGLSPREYKKIKKG